MNSNMVRAWMASCAIGFSSAACAADPALHYQKEILPVLEDYCYDCHGEGTKKGGLAMDKYSSLETHLNNTEYWLSVWKNLDSQLMPPAEKPQPAPADRERLLRWIETAVFKVDPANPDPGRVTVRRLNREEYRNTVLDLLGVKFEVDDAFPADDTGYGFDTIGDVLNLSPLLMEKYLDAAQEVVKTAIEDAHPRIPTEVVAAEKFGIAGDPSKTAKTLPFSEPATVSHLQQVEHPGRYRVTVEMRVSGSMDATTHTAKVGLRVRDKTLETANLGWDYRKSIELTGEADLARGDNPLAIEVVPGNPPLENENFLNLNVLGVKLHGPLDGSHLKYPEEYRRVFLDGAPPSEPAARAAYGRKILRHFAGRAFRRPVDEATLDRLVSLMREVEHQPGMSFERGIGHAMTAVLASPRFLFRAETQPEPNNPGRIVPLDEFALAARLSYFLWSSLPDEELFGLAQKGELRVNLRAQVDRLLADARSRRFVSNFVGQWLQTRDVEGMNVDARRFLGVRKSSDAMKIFNPRVRRSMREETEMLFDHLLVANRSALELLTADYTFLNEPLARLYGIEGVEGNDMRKVSLGPESKRRGGILAHGSTLLVTSNPTRTSPVKRGLFILDNILGTPAPPAPPNVPELENARERGGDFTMRELMEVHREKALCASCHARMDPLGLALENFNPLGVYRAEENGKPIDTAGKLITGETFADVGELAKILATSRRHDFFRCLSEKLLTYSIGRGLEYYDTVTIEQIVAGAQKDGGTIRSLIQGIVDSAPFQKRRGDGQRLATSAPHSK